MDRPNRSPSQKADDKLTVFGARKMERLSRLAVINKRIRERYLRIVQRTTRLRSRILVSQSWPYRAISREMRTPKRRAGERSERKEKKKRYASDEGVGQCALLTEEVRFSEDNRSTYRRLARERAYTDQLHLQMLQH